MILTFIKLPFVIMIFVLSIFESPFYTVLTVFRIKLAVFGDVVERFLDFATILFIGAESFEHFY